MFPDLNNFLYGQTMPAANNLLEKALAGDVSTIVMLGIAAIVVFVAVVLLVELAAWLINLVKRLLLFIIVAASTGLFLFSFQSRIFAAEPSTALVAAGAIGTAFAIVAFAISFISLKREWQKPKEQKISELKSEMKKLVSEQFERELAGNVQNEAMPEITAAQARQAAPVSRQAPAGFFALFHDRGLLAVLSYVIVVEFGVISGIAISMPSIDIGLIFFALFLVAALVFIKSTYHSSLKGIKHFLVALAAGGALSIALSNVWLSIPLETLLSPQYFQTSALVALVAGIGVSLFVGSRS
ncbi:MAG: hypothetical protein WC634_03595 [archaeon]